jgi:predicted alpha/beta hydrolase
MAIETIHVCTQLELKPELREQANANAIKENPANADNQLPAADFRALDIKPPQLAILIGKKWAVGRTLSVRFMGGSATVQAKVRQYASEWSKFANIKFDFNNADNAEIRIAFQLGKGSWSYIGTDALSIAKSDPTMNFGWLTDATSDTEFSRVIIHEFGHALGAIHEHQSPAASIPWDKPAVYAYYKSTNGWDAATVDVNIFQHYEASSTQFSSFDDKSIMLYAIPDSLTLGTYSVGWNTVLAPMDKSFIASIYPYPPSSDWQITNSGVGEFANWAATSGVKVVSGNFGGNNRTSIALVRQSAGWGTIPVAFSIGDGAWSITNQPVGDFANWAATSGVKIVTGDFNGNGTTDIALVRQEAGWGTIPVAFATGGGSWSITNQGVGSFAQWAATSGVKVITGDFDGNGRTDIALIRQNPGWATIPVAFSAGSGNWTITNQGVGNFAQWAATSGVAVITGDFDGNGRTDIALVRREGGWGTIPIAFASGSGNWFITNGGVGAFASWAATSGVRIVTGDFNGNGRTDIALIRQTPGWGTIPIAFANGNGSWTITNSVVGAFAGWACQPGVTIVTGDFNGNGRTDIALVRQTPGWATVPIASANGDGSWTITNKSAAQFTDWAATNGVLVLSGKFDTDSRTDLALIRQTPGWATIPTASYRD